MITLRRRIARDERLETWLADDGGEARVVERLRPELPVDEEAVRAVVQAMGTAPHRGIERALSYAGHPPTWVFAVDDAASLADLVRMGGGGAPTEVALVVTAQLARALAALDQETRARPRLALPPTRIRIGRDRGVVLQDPGFLAALLAVDGGPRGADRAFAAPELLTGAPTSERSEVFALGALLHQLVAEEAAWSPDRGVVVLTTGLEPDLRALLSRALARTPAERPSSSALVEGLEAALAARQVTDPAAVLGAWLADVAASRVVEVERRPDPFDAEAWLASFTASHEPTPGPARAPAARPGTARLELDVHEPEATRTVAGPAPWDEDTTPAGPAPRAPQDPHDLTVTSAPRPRPARAVSDDPLLGLVLHGYRLERALGAGAFARVYLGQHLHLDRRAAVKVLRGTLAASPVARRRMAREASALASVRHPNLVALLDFGLTPSGLPFLITELLEGQTLEAAAQRTPRQPPAEVARLGAELARGLAAAHAVGVVHRDLKPANVMLVDGHAKLLDFGLARMTDGPTRLTDLDALIGTPLYMAPEQIRGASTAGASADLYSLGVLLYQALAGVPPFTGALSEVLDAHLRQPPPPLPASGGVERVVLQLLSKDPADRPPSAASVAEHLDTLAGRAPSHAEVSGSTPGTSIVSPAPRPPTRGSGVVPARAQPDVRRARLEAWAGFVLAVVALALALWRR